MADATILPDARGSREPNHHLAYLPLFVRDWWSDPHVRALPWLHQQLYLNLLMLSWETGPLTDPPEALLHAIGWDGKHVSRTARAASVVEALQSRFFPGGRNPRLEKERTHANSVRAGNSDRTGKGWETRRANAEQMHSTSSAMQSQAQAQVSDSVPTVREPQAAPAPVSRARKEKPDKPGTPQAELVKWFSKCWAFYRRNPATGEPVPYLPAPPKEYVAASRLLKVYDRAEIENRAKNMLELDDPYHFRGASLCHLHGDWLKFAMRPIARNGRAV